MPDTGIDDLLGTATPSVPAMEGTAEDVADWIGVQPRRVASLAAEGRVIRLGRNRFDLQASVRGYCAFLRDKALPGPVAGNSRAGIAAEKERLTREQADAVALKNRQARGELIPASEVEREWANLLRDVRSSMLAVPSRIQSRLSHLTAEEVAAIDREVRDALTEMAQGQGDA